MSNRGSFTLFRVRGVPVRAHWTLLLVLPWIAWVFSLQFAEVAAIAGVDPSRVLLAPWVWGLLLALALFACVAIHEIAHTLVALRGGGKVKEITLMLLGGMSQIERMPQRRGLEAEVAAAGPLVSVALAGLLYVLYDLCPARFDDARLGLYFLSELNLVLGLFNLVPAFPLDGGRILRGLLEGPIGRVRATRIAASLGMGLAVAMGLAGILMGSFLLVLIGIFVYAGARQEAAVEITRDFLDRVRVADLMIHTAPTIDVHTALADAPRRMRELGRLELVVVDEENRPLGMLTAAQLRDMSPFQRSFLRVRDILARVQAVAVFAHWRDRASDAFARADEANAEYVVVVDPDIEGGPHLVGILSRADVELSRALHELEGLSPDSAPFLGVRRPQEG